MKSQEESQCHCVPAEGLRDQDSVMQPRSTCACLSAVKVEDGSGMQLLVLIAILMGIYPSICVDTLAIISLTPPCLASMLLCAPVLMKWRRHTSLGQTLKF